MPFTSLSMHNWYVCIFYALLNVYVLSMHYVCLFYAQLTYLYVLLICYTYIDHCECCTGDDDCEQICINTVGSYTCFCISGYKTSLGNSSACEGKMIRHVYWIYFIINFYNHSYTVKD